MATDLIRWEHHMNLLFGAKLLCQVCEARAWTQRARWCAALICESCAEGEPEPDEEEANAMPHHDLYWTSAMAIHVALLAHEKQHGCRMMTEPCPYNDAMESLYDAALDWADEALPGQVARQVRHPQP